jgi:hypothetical protein
MEMELNYRDIGTTRISNELCYLPSLGWCSGISFPLVFVRNQGFSCLTKADNWVSVSKNYWTSLSCGVESIVLSQLSDPTLSGLEINNYSTFTFAF